jgi:hypothetical protein
MIVQLRFASLLTGLVQSLGDTITSPVMHGREYPRNQTAAACRQAAAQARHAAAQAFICASFVNFSQLAAQSSQTWAHRLPIPALYCELRAKYRAPAWQMSAQSCSRRIWLGSVCFPPTCTQYWMVVLQLVSQS